MTSPLVPSYKLRVSLLKILITHPTTAHHQTKRQFNWTQVHVIARVLEPGHTLERCCLIVFNNWPSGSFECAQCIAYRILFLETRSQCNRIFKREFSSRTNRKMSSVYRIAEHY